MGKWVSEDLRPCLFKNGSMYFTQDSNRLRCYQFLFCERLCHERCRCPFRRTRRGVTCGNCGVELGSIFSKASSTSGAPVSHPKSRTPLCTLVNAVLVSSLDECSLADCRTSIQNGRRPGSAKNGWLGTRGAIRISVGTVMTGDPGGTYTELELPL